MLEIYDRAQEGVIKNFRKDSLTGNLTTLFLQLLKIPLSLLESAHKIRFLKFLVANWFEEGKQNAFPLLPVIF